MAEKMKYPNGLLAAMQRADKGPAVLARILGTNRQNITRWSQGERKLPVDVARQLAPELATTPEALLLGEAEGAPDEVRLPSEGYRPPPEILGERDFKVFAAVEGGAGEMVVSTDPIDTVPRPWYMKGVRNGFAVLVVGESMIPAFEPGDMAVVNPRLPPMRGKDVILIADEQHGEFRASIKRLENWDAKTWNLRQFNPPKGQKPELSWSKKDWPKALRVVGKYYGG